VTATSGSAVSVSVTSSAVSIPVLRVGRCPGASGNLAGTHLGPIRLGMTRSQARHAYQRSSTRGQAYQDFFCLTPIGIRAGYASPKLLANLAKTRRSADTGRIVWISTASAFYAVQHIRRGATITAADARLKLGHVFVIGANDWYLAPLPSATAVLKVRRRPAVAGGGPASARRS
jgi:hypothetical protein